MPGIVGSAIRWNSTERVGGRGDEVGRGNVGLAVSIAGNIGHIQAQASRPVILADRLTAATSPIAAFAGLAIGLLVLKMTRQHADVPARDTTAGLMLAPR